MVEDARRATQEVLGDEGGPGFRQQPLGLMRELSTNIMALAAWGIHIRAGMSRVLNDVIHTVGSYTAHLVCRAGDARQLRRSLAIRDALSLNDGPHDWDAINVDAANAILYAANKAKAARLIEYLSEGRSGMECAAVVIEKW